MMVNRKYLIAHVLIINTVYLISASKSPCKLTLKPEYETIKCTLLS